MRIEVMQIATALDRPIQDRVAEICTRIAESRDVDLVTLPELWPTGYFAFDDYEATAQPLDGPIRRQLGEAAAAAGIHLHAGSMVERDESGRLFNTSMLFAPDGSLAHVYRKFHLFGHQSRESALLRPGSEITTYPASFGQVGLSTCYDLRFPELYRVQVSQGAELFLVTAAWPAARLDHWRLHVRMRAVENQSFLLATNAAGTQHGVDLAGHSVLVDPWGEVLVEADTTPQALRVEVDLARVSRFRAEFPSLADRRIDIRYPTTQPHQH